VYHFSDRAAEMSGSDGLLKRTSSCAWYLWHGYTWRDDECPGASSSMVALSLNEHCTQKAASAFSFQGNSMYFLLLIATSLCKQRGLSS
jgi:hypothetical protein